MEILEIIVKRYRWLRTKKKLKSLSGNYWEEENDDDGLVLALVLAFSLSFISTNDTVMDNVGR